VTAKRARESEREPVRREKGKKRKERSKKENKAFDFSFLFYLLIQRRLKESLDLAIHFMDSLQVSLGLDEKKSLLFPSFSFFFFLFLILDKK